MTVPHFVYLIIIKKSNLGLFYYVSREENVILVYQMFLDPKIFITGGKEDDLLPLPVVPASEDVHGLIEKLSLIISHNNLVLLEHFPLLPFPYPVPPPGMDPNKHQILLILSVPDMLEHAAGEGQDSLSEYKFSSQLWQNI